MVSIETLRKIIAAARALRPDGLIWVQPRGYPIAAPYWPATPAQVAIAEAYPHLRVSRPAHSRLVGTYHQNTDSVDFTATDRRDLFRAFMDALHDPLGVWGVALGYDQADEHLHVDARDYADGAPRIRLERDQVGPGVRWRVTPSDPDWDRHLAAAARQYGFRRPEDALSGPSWVLWAAAAGAAYLFWRRRKKRRKEKSNPKPG